MTSLKFHRKTPRKPITDAKGIVIDDGTNKWLEIDTSSDIKYLNRLRDNFAANVDKKDFEFKIE